MMCVMRWGNSCSIFVGEGLFLAKVCSNNARARILAAMTGTSGQKEICLSFSDRAKDVPFHEFPQTVIFLSSDSKGQQKLLTFQP